MSQWLQTATTTRTQPSAESIFSSPQTFAAQTKQSILCLTTHTCLNTSKGDRNLLWPHSIPCTGVRLGETRGFHLIWNIPPRRIRTQPRGPSSLRTTLAAKILACWVRQNVLCHQPQSLRSVDSVGFVPSLPRRCRQLGSSPKRKQQWTTLQSYIFRILFLIPCPSTSVFIE